MAIRNRIKDYPGPLVPQNAGTPGADGADVKSTYQSYLDTTDDDPVLTEEQWAAARGTNSTTISANPPASPQEGDVWIDTDGWIISTWNADLTSIPGEDMGAWVTTQGLPSNAYYIYWDTYQLAWSASDGADLYYLYWTPAPA
jgi:hypothetical protein